MLLEPMDSILAARPPKTNSQSKRGPIILLQDAPNLVVIGSIPRWIPQYLMLAQRTPASSVLVWRLRLWRL